MNVQAIGKPVGAKLIRLSASIEKEIVTAISIRGDFFAIPEEGFERVEARLPGTELGKFAARFDELLTEEGVEPYGISGAAVAEVLDDAIRAAVGLK
ncbi:MAG: hypothetical protein WCT14_06620 [Treponemataceae bacterium]